MRSSAVLVLPLLCLVACQESSRTSLPDADDTGSGVAAPGGHDTGAASGGPGRRDAEVARRQMDTGSEAADAEEETWTWGDASSL